MTFPVLILTLCCAGYAIAASVCAILLKRTVDDWWDAHYGRKSRQVCNDRTGQGYARSL
jgi:hypothetical protein